MSGSVQALVIIGIVAASLSIIAMLYLIASSRRKVIFFKKADYLIEDITYKSEMLNPTVETIAKVSNYIDVFDTIARKNMKSAARVVSRNKDDIYKIINRIKKAAVGPEETKAKKKGGKK
ncbi:MAG: hypothetical protein KAG91_02655 [Mycoplasmataceae bacterium]|nr:hypothetical protein [Mycoplasmataceae bacterium]